MIRNASRLIAEAFDLHDVKYHIVEVDDASIVEASFPVTMGPQVVVRFISNSEDNDVAVRVFGLLCKIPADKRTEMLEACNQLTGKIRFLKFYVDREGDINAEYDFPVRMSDDCLGECCHEMFVRIMQILDSEFHILAEALYSQCLESESKSDSLLELLEQLQEKTITISDDGQ